MRKITHNLNLLTKYLTPNQFRLSLELEFSPFWVESWRLFLLSSAMTETTTWRFVNAFRVKPSFRRFWIIVSNCTTGLINSTARARVQVHLVFHCGRLIKKAHAAPRPPTSTTQQRYGYISRCSCHPKGAKSQSTRLGTWPTV